LTIRCSAPIDETVHVRNLHAYRTLTGPGSLGDPAVLIHHDDQVVFLSNNGLVALRLPSLRSAVHAAPPGCRYQALTGTETELVALLQCGSRDALSIVSISLRSFDVTGTLLRLGSCLAGEDISLAPRAPSVMLAETYLACLRPGRLPGDFRILIVRGHKTTVLLSGRYDHMPQDPVW